MGLLDKLGAGRRKSPQGTTGSAAKRAPGAKRGAGTKPGSRPGFEPRGVRPKSAGSAGAPGRPSRPGSASRAAGGAPAAPAGGGKLSGRKGKRRTPPKDRVAGAAAPLHDRRRRLVGARETTLRDLGGLMLEMYKRNRFREELLLDKCEEVLAVEVEIAHIDQRLFQLAPPNAAGMRPIGRCECGAPIHPGQNFCGVCGRSFETLTQGRACGRCNTALRPADQFCATCGTEAPDVLQALAAPPRPERSTPIDAPGVAAAAVAQTVVIDMPSVVEAAPASATDDVPSLDTEVEVAPTASAARAAADDLALDPLELAAPGPSRALSLDHEGLGAPLATAATPKPAPAGRITEQAGAAIEMALETPELLDELPAGAPRFTAFPLTEPMPPGNHDDSGTSRMHSPNTAPTAEDPPGAATPADDASPKRVAAQRKQREREARDRAKKRAKAARAARKRDGR